MRSITTRRPDAYHPAAPAQYGRRMTADATIKVPEEKLSKAREEAEILWQEITGRKA